MTTTNVTFRTVEEAEVVVKYGPVRPDHENRLLTALTEFNNIGLVTESSFETGQFTVYIEVEPLVEDDSVEKVIKNTLDEVYGEVAVAKAKVSVDFDSYETY